MSSNLKMSAFGLGVLAMAGGLAFAGGPPPNVPPPLQRSAETRKTHSERVLESQTGRTRTEAQRKTPPSAKRIPQTQPKRVAPPLGSVRQPSDSTRGDPSQSKPKLTESKKLRPTALVDWSYWRMHCPQVIFGMVRQVQQGKSPKSALNGAMSHSMIDAAIAGKIVRNLPQSLARETKLKPVRSLPKMRATPAEPKAVEKAIVWSDVTNALKPSMEMAHVGLSADYSPDKLNFEPAPYWMTRTKAIRIVSPTTGSVTASWKPVAPQKISALPNFGKGQNPFRPASFRKFEDAVPDALIIKRMVSHTGEIKNGLPVTDKEVLGGGPLPIKSGQDFLIEVQFKSPFPMGGVNAALLVNGPNWSFEVPVAAGATSIEKYDIAVEWTQSAWIDTVQGGAPVVGLKLKNKGYYPVTVSLDAQSLPLGVGLSPFTPVKIDPGKEVNASVVFNVAAETPEGWGQGRIAAHLSNGGALGYNLPALDFYVRKTWAVVDVPYHRCGKSDVYFSMHIAYSHDGSWYFGTYAYDDGTIFGDQYVAYFVFNAWIDGKQIAATVMDKLDPGDSGSKETSGVDSRIHDHWTEIYDQGIEWHIVTNPDATAFIKWYAETLLSLATS